jgi:hypothetical protein
MVVAAIGLPHFGHAGAASLTEVEQSGQAIRDTGSS